MHEFFTLDIHCQFVSVSLKCLKRSSEFIIHLSNFRLNVGAKQLVVDVKVSRASKPLKLVALSYSANVSIGWILSLIGGSSSNSHRFHNFPNGTFTNFILPPQRPLARRHLLAQLCNDFTSLGFSHVGCLKFHPFPVAIPQSRGSRKRYE